MLDLEAQMSAAAPEWPSSALTPPFFPVNAYSTPSPPWLAFYLSGPAPTTSASPLRSRASIQPAGNVPVPFLSFP